MAVADVLKVFRDLKREGTVRDYLLFGSIAVMVHTRPHGRGHNNTRVNKATPGSPLGRNLPQRD